MLTKTIHINTNTYYYHDNSNNKYKYRHIFPHSIYYGNTDTNTILWKCFLMTTNEVIGSKWTITVVYQFLCTLYTKGETALQAIKLIATFTLHHSDPCHYHRSYCEEANNMFQHYTHTQNVWPVHSRKKQAKRQARQINSAEQCDSHLPQRCRPVSNVSSSVFPLWSCLSRSGSRLTKESNHWGHSPWNMALHKGLALGLEFLHIDHSPPAHLGMRTVWGCIIWKKILLHFTNASDITTYWHNLSCDKF